jgi:hypothetical protein
MVHHQVVGGGDDLQMWRATANVLNTQSQQVTNSGCPPDLALNGGLRCCHCKKLTCYMMSYKGSDRSFGIRKSSRLL